MTKEEIAQNKQFLLFPQCFLLLVIGYHSIIEIFYFLTKYVQSRLLQHCRMRERVKRDFWHFKRDLLDKHCIWKSVKYMYYKETTIISNQILSYRCILTHLQHLQRTTFDNIVEKGDTAHNKQLLLWPQSFQLHSIIVLSFTENFHIFIFMPSCFQIFFLTLNFSQWIKQIPSRRSNFWFICSRQLFNKYG